VLIMKLHSFEVDHHHLSRKAIIYIRQSTPHQVLTNQESLNLQYAFKRGRSNTKRPNWIVAPDAPIRQPWNC
jgi:hypothetical protein